MEASNVTPILWIGTVSDTCTAIKAYVVDVVAPCKGCARCRLCGALEREAQDVVFPDVPPFLISLKPKEHGYVREQIDDVLSLLTVALDSHESSVIVIGHADQLNSATANRLLKIIEEPPPGWHIMFATERPEDILPTLRSRCIEKVATVAAQDDDFCSLATMAWLENPRTATWLEAASKIDQLPRTVPATVAALDRLIYLWHEQWTAQQDPRAEGMLSILTEMSEKLPSSGGATSFWRVLLTKVYRSL